MQQVTVIEAPEVRELLVRLGQAREQYYTMGADKLKADLEANRLVSEIGQVKSQLDAKERALAISGELPEEAFPEEAQIARLERQHRVALARVSATEERVAASRNAIDGLKKQLDSAWLLVGVEGCREVLVRFRHAGLALRKIQCEYRAWLQCFSNKTGIPNWDAATAVVMDPFPNKSVVTEDDGCVIWMGHLVDNRMMSDEPYWRPLVHELADAIQSLHSEVEAAKRGIGDNNG